MEVNSYVNQILKISGNFCTLSLKMAVEIFKKYKLYFYSNYLRTSGNNDMLYRINLFDICKVILNYIKGMINNGNIFILYFILKF